MNDEQQAGLVEGLIGAMGDPEDVAIPLGFSAVLKYLDAEGHVGYVRVSSSDVTDIEALGMMTWSAKVLETILTDWSDDG